MARPAVRSARSAFSLVEVICAIAILAIGLVGLVQGVTTALSSSKEAELQTTAALFAAGQIETIRADGFVIEGESDGDCGPDLEAYEWRQNVTSTPLDGLFEINVVIEHAKTGKQIYQLQTLMFDPTSYPSTSTADETKNKERERERNRP
jgi:prepilin-type N-terminal cleavage/methylation domain-containing protein